MEENFSMEWKIFGMEWKWNGRKLPVWNMEKSSSIPFHTMPWLPDDMSIPRTLYPYLLVNGSHLLFKLSLIAIGDWERLYF